MSDSYDNIHEGHRQRMREKLLNHGQEVFNTYELLEMLLYHVIPYKDTNPVAKNLFIRFRSIDRILSATKEELMQIDGIGEKTAELILSVGAFSDAILHAKRSKDDVCFDDYDETAEFLYKYFEKLEDGKQTVLVMLLDSRMRLLGVEEIGDFDYGTGAVHPEAFTSAALHYNASVAITAHNHPYGPLFPTASDSVTNTLIEDALSKIGVSMIEHYIFSGRSYVGIMTNLKSAFSQRPEVFKFIESKRRKL